MASEKHKELAAFIKGVHQGLRLLARAVGADQAWNQHCQQIEILEKYAEKMQILATECWEKKNEEENDFCRIHWVVKHSTDYFYKNGFESAVARENKMCQIYFNKSVMQLECSGKTLMLNPLKLLDVGSCYNPFSKFSLFEVTALDIMPAVSDVLKCDFLSVDTSGNTKKITSPCFVLPEKYFDIVVFSLVLEYLPSSRQRLKFSKNAYEVLKPCGLLFILTPDSKHATANSKMMRNWRFALASLGFWRVSYQKLKHLHCMSYRKCFNGEVPRHWLSLQKCEKQPEDLLYIPQDFHEYCDNVREDEPFVPRCDIDNKLLAETFTNFPDSDIFS